MAESSLYRSGSDQTFEHECSSCQYDGATVEATGYCVDCTEYLCDTCIAFHKRSRASRGHTVLKGKDLQQSLSANLATQQLNSV